MADVPWLATNPRIEHELLCCVCLRSGLMALAQARRGTGLQWRLVLRHPNA